MSPKRKDLVSYSNIPSLSRNPRRSSTINQRPSDLNPRFQDLYNQAINRVFVAPSLLSTLPQGPKEEVLIRMVPATHINRKAKQLN